jgi:hypothetical protein
MPTRRAEEHQYQTHALRHFAIGCSGKIPVRGEWNQGLCPLCLRWINTNDLTRDHAPPQAGQTMLGLPHLEILVCQECNGSAGRTYEGAADQVRRSTRVPWPFCEVHEHCLLSLDSGLFIPTKDRT